ncbi:MAG: DUF4440 domain-containing protein [bacterium]|nr:DUF4440 domain-containing protein [bacterium]
MEISKEDFDKLRELEESLWRPETRFDNEYMNRVLAADFFEFGRSGHVYKREETLGARQQPINIALPFNEFNIRLIDTDVALVTYLSEVQYDEKELGNRSSVWLKEDGEWKLKFHQGTPTIR